MQHVVATETHKELRTYIPEMHDVLITIQRHNSLCINGDKMEFLNFCCDNNEQGSNFTITDNHGSIIKQK